MNAMATNGMRRPRRASARALEQPKASGPVIGLLVGLAIALFLAIHCTVIQ
jgi:hypothetical protein